MKSFKLTGFGPVFGFTFKSHVKSKKFIITTALFAILIIAGIVIAMLVSSDTDEAEEGHEFKIDKVFVSDKTELGVPSYAEMAAAFKDENVEKIEFEEAADSAKTAKENENNPVFVMVEQSLDEEEDVFVLNIVTGKGVDDTDVKILGDSLKVYFQQYLYENSGLSEAELVEVLRPVDSEVARIGEEENEGREMVLVITTFAIIMLVYFMILFYGQSVCTEVSMEKTSKLVEQMLTNITPYGLVSGKILAVILASMLQVLIWIASIVVGAIVGNEAVKAAYGIKTSKIAFYLDTLSEWFKGGGFSAAAIILCIVSLVLGLVFYLVLAGLAGSMVTKPEEAPNMQTIFIIPMVIAFIIVLGALVSAEGNLSLAYSLIPFTGAMCAPGMILVGNMSIAMAVVSILISGICSMLILWIAAKIYKGLLFYSGNKISPKLILGIIKGK